MGKSEHLLTFEAVRGTVSVSAQPDVHFHLSSQSCSALIQQTHVYTETSKISWKNTSEAVGFGKIKAE